MEVSRSEDTTIYTMIYTPSATVASEEDKPINQPTSSVPQPGKAFIIRNTKTSHLLTLLNGNVQLQPAGTLGSAYHWKCHENEGWLGFENVAAGKYLGHNFWGSLYASATHQRGWENFDVRLMSDGGYVLLMLNWGQLCSVKAKHENGVQQLEISGASVDQGLRWEFIEV